MGRNNVLSVPFVDDCMVCIGMIVCGMVDVSVVAVWIYILAFEKSLSCVAAVVVIV